VSSDQIVCSYLSLRDNSQKSSFAPWDRFRFFADLIRAYRQRIRIF